MPARPSNPRPATGRGLADSAARSVERMGAGPQTVYAEVPGLKYFHPVAVRLLRNFPAASDQFSTRAKAGQEATVELMPTGCFYLSIDDSSGERQLLSMDATDGVDFDFVNERL